MEKKIYEKPAMQVEAFVANHYCADCSDSDHTRVTYIFACGYKLGTPDDHYWITDSNGHYVSIDGKYYGPNNGHHYSYWYYHPCTSYHEITVGVDENPLDAPDVHTGYYLDHQNTPGKDMIPVVLWTENGTTMHATVQRDPSKWQLAKS